MKKDLVALSLTVVLMLSVAAVIEYTGADRDTHPNPQLAASVPAPVSPVAASTEPMPDEAKAGPGAEVAGGGVDELSSGMSADSPDPPIQDPKTLERDIHEWVLDNSAGAIEARQRQEDALAAKRIDLFYAQRGGPMQGLGATMVEVCKRYGVSPYVVTAISEAESSSGRVCCGSFNAFGLLAHTGGFGSWEEAIAACCDFIVTYNPDHTPRVYCEPPSPYYENVMGLAQSIAGYEVGP